LIHWHCSTCGYNGAEVKRAIHNRFQDCPKCNQEFVYKWSSIFTLDGFLWINNADLERIALGWG